MRKTFKYRLFPTKAQRTKLNNTLEFCRQVYNETLATRKNAWEEHQKSISLYDTHNLLTAWKKDKPELKEVYSQILQNVQVRVDLAFQAFFRRVKNGDKPGYPRFKGYGRYDSFTFPQYNFGFKEPENGKVSLSKIGDVKIKLHRPIEGEIKTLTIQRDRVGNWYACFSCIVEAKPLPSTHEVVGVDVGLSSFATLSTGEKIDNPRFFKRDEKALKKIQRKVSSTEKDDPKYKKHIKVLNHIHQRITNRRKDFAHKLSRRFIDKYQVIVFEKLDIKNMMDNNFRAMNRSISDVAWHRFVQFSTSKAEEAGRIIVKVDPKNTTQACSGCNSIVPKDLSVRVHNCPYCGLILDRDHNAALNILSRGLATLDASS